MADALLKISLYEDLLSLPDSITGEILNGQLYGHPRPGGRHVLIASNICGEFQGPFQRGKGGPGGWLILVEPEVHFELDREVAVPDVAGWLKSRMPIVPVSHKFTIVPDWICEVLSPSTESIDRNIKMPLYAKHGVRFFWLIDPVKQELEAYRLKGSDWELMARYSVADRASIPPFDDFVINLSDIME